MIGYADSDINGEDCVYEDVQEKVELGSKEFPNAKMGFFMLPLATMTAT